MSVHWSITAKYVIFFQFEGWDNFDERRRSKHQKQIEFRVGVSRDFDEGADKN